MEILRKKCNFIFFQGGIVMRNNANTVSIVNTRSVVGQNMRLGTVVLKSPKDYDRKREKQNLRRMLKEAIR